MIFIDLEIGILHKQIYEEQQALNNLFHQLLNGYDRIR